MHARIAAATFDRRGYPIPCSSGRDVRNAAARHDHASSRLVRGPRVLARGPVGRLPFREAVISGYIMTKLAVSSKELGPAVGPFSLAVRTSGLMFVSGQVGIDPKTSVLVDGGIESQTAQVLQNLNLVLEAADKSFADVVRVSVYLTSMGDFAAMNAIYKRYFAQPYPARTTIAVVALPLGASVEMDMVVE